mgnify:CR=1 FL=1
MMSVALFVGAVATNMIIAGTLSGEKAKNRRDYLLARLAVNGVIAVGEGVLVYLAVHVLGLSANLASRYWSPSPSCSLSPSLILG